MICDRLGLSWGTYANNEIKTWPYTGLFDSLSWKVRICSHGFSDWSSIPLWQTTPQSNSLRLQMVSIGVWGPGIWELVRAQRPPWSCSWAVPGGLQPSKLWRELDGLSLKRIPPEASGKRFQFFTTWALLHRIRRILKAEQPTTPSMGTGVLGFPFYDLIGGMTYRHFCHILFVIEAK